MLFTLKEEAILILTFILPELLQSMNKNIKNLQVTIYHKISRTCHDEN